MIKYAAVMALVGLIGLSAGSFADEDKDESGKGWQKREEGKERREERRQHEGGSTYFDQHGYNHIPNGHLPPPGECRIWYPDRPAGHQPPPFKCGQARGPVEPGGWVIAPGPRPNEVEAWVYDARRPGIVIDVGIFDARTGSMIRVLGTK